ncbi:DUF4326 domain-containing protein [Bradyrhizobium sp.]|uniref:DUF4326 domain-containing protein n=1 Tax=Bradyrhizobium sp. TaxID=376 RepID=UPI0025BC739C|nr:DUF4326 domain-containing protein [Bradyrhizobium sp.]MCA3256251.1 DUF4326 domain-containing protein [Alphaproteobacteria bacterium]MCA3570686.1 DUF4326 domain-containing protein [Bradyrhizobium sp.]
MADGQTPKRILLSRAKGWRLPENTVVVARPSKWGNPYPVTARNGFHPKEAGYTRAQAIDAFRALLGSFDEPTWQRDIHELRGKNLACWCPLDEPCHADVLLELANAPADGGRA